MCGCWEVSHVFGSQRRFGDGWDGPEDHPGTRQDLRFPFSPNIQSVHRSFCPHAPPPIPSPPKRIPRLTSFIHTHTHSHARTHTCITTTRFTPDYVGGMNMIESVLPWSSLTRFPHKSFDGMDRWMDRWMMGGMAFHREIQVCMYTSIPNVLFVLLSLYGTFCFFFFFLTTSHRVHFIRTTHQVGTTTTTTTTTAGLTHVPVSHSHHKHVKERKNLLGAFLFLSNSW